MDQANAIYVNMASFISLLHEAGVAWTLENPPTAMAGAIKKDVLASLWLDSASKRQAGTGSGELRKIQCHTHWLKCCCFAQSYSP